jgi:hypothetical protein
MKLKIKREHINKGVRKSMTKCPIAIALRERTHRPVSVWGNEIDVAYCNVDTVYSMNSAVSDFINKFDRGVTVRPTTLELFPE